jgi:hypothetical protein
MGEKEGGGFKALAGTKFDHGPKYDRNAGHTICRSGGNVTIWAGAENGGIEVSAGVDEAFHANRVVELRMLQLRIQAQVALIQSSISKI